MTAKKPFVVLQFTLFILRLKYMLMTCIAIQNTDKKEYSLDCV